MGKKVFIADFAVEGGLVILQVSNNRRHYIFELRASHGEDDVLTKYLITKYDHVRTWLRFFGVTDSDLNRLDFDDTSREVTL